VNGGVSETFCNGVDEAANLIESLQHDKDLGAIWTNIQRLKPGSSRRKKGDTIDAYTNILVDIDRKVKKDGDGNKTNATNEEREVLRLVAEKIAAYLTPVFGPCVFADSGNGFHLNWKLADIEPGDGQRYYRALLNLLRCKFESPDVNVEIDTSLADDTQVVTVWGTWNRKYPDTPDRPQRQSEVLFVPSSQKPIKFYDLEIFLAENKVEGGGEKQEDETPRTSSIPRQKADPDWLENYGVPHLVEFFSDYIAYEEIEYEKADGIHHPIKPCPCHEGEDFHEHSHARDCEIIVFKDGGIGISCFRRDFGLKQVIKKLNILKGENYPYLVFAEPTDAEVNAAFGVEDLNLTDKVEPPPIDPLEPEPVEPGETAASKKRLKIARVKDLAGWVIGAILRDPVGTLLKFRMLKSHLASSLKEYVGEGKDRVWLIDSPMRQVLMCILAYYEDTGSLPSRGELLNWMDESSYVIARKVRKLDDFGDIRTYVANLQDDPTKEFAPMAAELDRATNLVAKRLTTQKNYDKYLKTGSGEDTQEFDIEQRKHAQRKLYSSGDILPGPIQSMTGKLDEEFRKYFDGANEDGRFETGFDAIDDNSLIGVGSGREHTIFIYGGTSNFKTTLLVTIAINAARRGKNGLILIGEHEALEMMVTLILMLGYFVKDDPEIGQLPSRADLEHRRVTEEDWRRIRRLLDKLNEILPGYLGVQNINAVVQNEKDRLGSAVDYMHSFNADYPLDFVVIDPLSQLMPSGAMGRKEAWGDGVEMLAAIRNLSREFEGRKRGLVILMAAQVKVEQQREIEKVQAKNAAGMDQHDDKLIELAKQPSQIEFFSAISQFLDLGIGIVTRVKGGRDGYLVKGRARFLNTFESVSFTADLVANVIVEGKYPTTSVGAGPAPTSRPEATMEAIDEL
jgi:RecA/RadA recombinase